MGNSIKARGYLNQPVTVVKALIRHPMETGFRKHPETGKPIPAHFIQQIRVQHNGRDVLNADWGPAMSRNPFLRFHLRGARAGDTVRIRWEDNRGGHDEKELRLG